MRYWRRCDQHPKVPGRGRLGLTAWREANVLQAVDLQSTIYALLDRDRVDRRADAAGDRQARGYKEELVDAVLLAVVGQRL
jgi:hypothetical protein